MDQLSPILPSPGGALPTSVAQAAPKRKHPVGIVILLVLVGIGVLSQPFSLLFTKPIAMFGTVVVTGIPALLYFMISWGAYIALFVGLIRLKPWGRVLGMVLFGYYIIASVVYLLSLYIWPVEVAQAYEQVSPGFGQTFSPKVLLIISTVGVFVSSSIALSIVLYLFLKRNYFQV